MHVVQPDQGGHAQYLAYARGAMCMSMYNQPLCASGDVEGNHTRFALALEYTGPPIYPLGFLGAAADASTAVALASDTDFNARTRRTTAGSA